MLCDNTSQVWKALDGHRMVTMHSLAAVSYTLPSGKIVRMTGSKVQQQSSPSLNGSIEGVYYAFQHRTICPHSV